MSEVKIIGTVVNKDDMDEIREIVQRMANQRLTVEIPGEDYLHADFEDAYNSLVQDARELRSLFGLAPQRERGR